MKLLIDVGNSRIKWAWYDEGRLYGHQACDRQGDGLPQSVAEAWQAKMPISEVWLSSVAADSFNTALSNYWRAASATLRLVRVADFQQYLPTQYRTPSKLGVDRWLAMLAAWRHTQKSVCVAVCGTAMTLDWVDDQGIHQGGVIVPGIQRMQTSLSQAPGIVAAGGSNQQDSILGLDTQNGLRLGAEYALAGAIEQLFSQVQAKACYISGGNGEQVAARLRLAAEFQPDLVLQGLACLVRGID